MAVNDRAGGILRRGDGLADRNGMLRVRAADEQVRLDRLVGDALPASGAVAGTWPRRPDTRKAPSTGT